MPAYQRIGCAVVPLITFLLAILPLGCADSAPLPLNPGEPVGPQLTRIDPYLRAKPFRALLDFESETDAALVRADQPVHVDNSRAHTGRRSLAIAAQTRQFTIRLSSAFTEAQFPGQWTLAGGYLYAAEPTTVTLAYTLGGTRAASRTVALPAGQWTAVLVDLGLQPPAVIDSRFDGALEFTFEQPLAAPVWCDDVIVINNARTYVAASEPTDLSPAGWSIQQRGFAILVAQRMWSIALQTPEITRSGWTLLEANEMRACLSSPGREKFRAIYWDGRQFIDGQCHSAGPMKSIEKALSAQHQSPGEIEVPETMGKVDRATPGDQNNDGYNELLGAYQVVAAGPRIDIRMTPKGAPLIRPIIEIAELPAGKVTAALEGHLIGRVARTASGHVLIEVPGDFERATTVNVSVR